MIRMNLISDHTQPFELGVVKQNEKSGDEVYLREIGDRCKRK